MSAAPGSPPRRHRGPTAAAGSAVLERVQLIEAAAGLDRAVAALHAAVDARLTTGRARRLLGGAWLGHALHPLLTDLPIGFWTSAALVDVVGGRRGRPMATALVAAGSATALPTIATGLSDWAVLDIRQQRVGVVHAAANVVATGLYTASLVARLRGRHATGVALAVAGATSATAGGYLGGHLAAATDAPMAASADALGRAGVTGVVGRTDGSAAV